MGQFIINGGNKIGGTLNPLGNKNAVLPMLAACLLTDEKVVLSNVPRIKDVLVMLQLLEELGVEVNLQGHTVELQAKNIKDTVLPEKMCRLVRTSILLAGPMSARFGAVSVFPPGGDVIGRRRLDTHFYGLSKLGVEIDTTDRYNFSAKKLRGADLLLDEASVTATENIVMAAVLAEGQTSIYNAACEPHVEDLCILLNKMGAKISGLGTNRLVIEGVERLGGANHEVGIDHIELGSFAVAAAVTGGTLKVPHPSCPVTLRVMQKTFAKLNLEMKPTDSGELLIAAPDELKVMQDFGGVIPKIEDGIWPAFPSDLMSVTIVLATQAQGNILFFEKLFESRLYFVDHLMSMGANIVQCDPHRIVVSGKSPLRGQNLTSPDIRAGMAMVIAALCATGQSVISNAYAVDRGYEDVDGRLRALGADIIRVD